MPKLTADHRKALAMLADCPDGSNESLLLAHGFKRSTLAALILAGLTSASPALVIANKRPIEVLRFKITDAGRQARRP